MGACLSSSPAPHEPSPGTLSLAGTHVRRRSLRLEGVQGSSESAKDSSLLFSFLFKAWGRPASSDALVLCPSPVLLGLLCHPGRPCPVSLQCCSRERLPGAGRLGRGRGGVTGGGLPPPPRPPRHLPRLPRPPPRPPWHLPRPSPRPPLFYRSALTCWLGGQPPRPPLYFPGRAAPVPIPVVCTSDPRGPCRAVRV